MHSGDDEETRLRSVARQSIQSIQEARLRAERKLLEAKDALEEETRVLELLNASGARLASNLDPHSLAQAITDAATELSGAEFGAFFHARHDEAGDVFSLYTLSGAAKEAFDKLGHPRATPIFAPTFRGERVIRIADVRTDPRYGRMAPHYGMPAGHLPVCSYMAVPVVSRSGSVLGGLLFGHRECGVFTERSERLVVGIAAQAAIALDNARMYDQVKHAADDRARLLHAERSARSELERISVMKDEFLATLSHELRTPLNAVLGWADVLLSTNCADGEQTRRGLETIARNARAQAQLIDDLLDMNRIVSGKIRLDVQRVDLAAIVLSALDSVGPSLDAKSIALRKTIDPHAGPVFGDPHRLQQVVWNLLTNAVKFTPKGGKIDVLLQRVNSHVEIVVHDSGIGIDPSFLPHLFERFRQADASTTRKFGGLGLGLSIVKQLVELHGGGVRANSGGEGRGATFTVSLPVRAVQDVFNATKSEHPRSEHEVVRSASHISLVGLRVLVVDDEPDARELVRAVLLASGAEVWAAGSADRGLELMRAHRPDVVISDIGMPDRDGYQFMHDVRALTAADGGRTPAIALTAFARSSDRTRAMLAGYQIHVAKPIEPQELAAAVLSLAGNSREAGR